MKSQRVLILAIAVVLLGGVALLVWKLSSAPGPTPVVPMEKPEQSETGVSPSGLPSRQNEVGGGSTRPVLPSSSIAPPTAPGEAASTSPSSGPNTADKLSIPVAGVKPEQLRDTFTEARANGRVHDAIDIPAPHNAAVIACADGRILKLFHSEPGGTTVYQLGLDNKTVYYYAHLDHYAEGLEEGKMVKRGETIAYVGDTGDAGPGNYHLHFSVSIVSDPGSYWKGTNINPYPLLVK